MKKSQQNGAALLRLRSILRSLGSNSKRIFDGFRFLGLRLRPAGEGQEGGAGLVSGDAAPGGGGAAHGLVELAVVAAEGVVAHLPRDFDHRETGGAEQGAALQDPGLMQKLQGRGSDLLPEKTPEMGGADPAEGRQVVQGKVLHIVLMNMIQGGIEHVQGGILDRDGILLMINPEHFGDQRDAQAQHTGLVSGEAADHFIDDLLSDGPGPGILS